MEPMTEHLPILFIIKNLLIKLYLWLHYLYDYLIYTLFKAGFLYLIM